MTLNITRRGILGAAAAGSVAACSPKAQDTSFEAKTQFAKGAFAHGIASGDPLSDAVILWTRITPDNPNNGPVALLWEMALTNSFETLAATGTVTASAATNWTAKVDATDLTAGTQYYYRFRTGNLVSPIGKTRTLPQGHVDQARFAVVSCANWQHGFFNAYDLIARSGDFDAMLMLGDYLYEYPANKARASMAKIGRVHAPADEIVTLDDYRMRHAQYRTDPNLQSVTALMPTIAIWDDHESANDSWMMGAENHQPDTEGDWAQRKAVALRAYYEWMPVRDPKPGRMREALFRSFEWGNLVTMAAIETRLFGRKEPIVIDDYFDMLREEGGVEKFNTDILNDPNRDMLGEEQLDFVTETFKASKDKGVSWRLLANQVVMGKLQTPDLTPYIDEGGITAIEKEWTGIRDFVELSKYALPVYPDSWDGYPVARQKLYNALHAVGVDDMLVVTGDSHEFWANDLTMDDGTKMGVEVGTTSITSETVGDFMGDAAADYALLLTQTNKDVRYYNPLHHGYVDLTLTPQKADVKMVAIDTVDTSSYTSFDAAKFTIKPAKNSLRFSAPKGLNIKQRALFNGLG